MHPSLEENDMTGKFDTSGEAENTRLPGLQHKYGETALILSTHRCAMYCRHCFRKRLVGISEEETADNFEKAADYIREHREISNVPRGDTLLNSNEALEHFLYVLSSMEVAGFSSYRDAYAGYFSFPDHPGSGACGAVENVMTGKRKSMW